MAALSRVARHRVGRIVSQAQASRSFRGHEHTLIVHRDDRVHRPARVEFLNSGHARTAVIEADHHGPVPHRLSQRLAAVRANHYLGVEATRGPHEIGGPIGEAGH